MFDTLAINSILDLLIDKYGSFVAISKWNVGKGSKKYSSCEINMEINEKIEDIVKDMNELAKEKGFTVTHFRLEKWFNYIIINYLC